MPRRPRERVTIDLRGIGPRLRMHASVHGETVTAAVRKAVVVMLDAEVGPMETTRIVTPVDKRVVKVTLRVGVLHATQLAVRARTADVSQGAYVAALLDGMPPSPRSVDHGDAVAALADSTRTIAAMSSDIHGFLRLMRDFKSAEAERYRSGLLSLSKDMRLHLEVASRLVAGLASRQRLNGSRPAPGQGASG